MQKELRKVPVEIRDIHDPRTIVGSQNGDKQKDLASAEGPTRSQEEG